MSLLKNRHHDIVIDQWDEWVAACGEHGLDPHETADFVVGDRCDPRKPETRVSYIGKYPETARCIWCLERGEVDELEHFSNGYIHEQCWQELIKHMAENSATETPAAGGLETHPKKSL